MQKTVLITGADGFLGKNLTISLKETGKYKILKILKNDNLNALKE